jgi:rhodanese-related sulfurtransferase
MRLNAIPTMLSMLPSVFRGVDLRDLETIKRITREAYPSVPRISCETLVEWIRGNFSVLLVDVRSNEEFGVSHLHGAINLRTANDIRQAMAQRKPDKTILYCSVGFRSSRTAHILEQKGVTGVMNLEGSIFEWANDGRSIYQGEFPVQKVHPYGKRWAGLLKPGLASAC